jgi:uncharacterized protein (TIGR03437 family)
MSEDLPVTYAAPQGGPGGKSEAMVLKLAEGTALPRAATVSAASYGPAVSPGSIASAFGSALAPQLEHAVATPLPTSLGGTSVVLKDRAGVERTASLFVVSPGQINYLIPEGLAPGVAEVRVVRNGNTVAAGTARIENVAPALFTANATSRGVAAGSALRVSAQGTQTAVSLYECGAAAGSCTPLAIDLGEESDSVFLLLFGTGLRNRTSLEAVSATVGGVAVPVAFAGAQGELSGLDQMNLGPMPRSLAGRGELPVVLTVDGKLANTVTVAVQ